MFLIFCPTNFVKSSDQCFEKKPAAGENILGFLFIQKKIFFFENSTVFCGFSVPPNRKKPTAVKILGNPFFVRWRQVKNFPNNFSISSDLFFTLVRDPPEKFGENVYANHRFRFTSRSEYVTFKKL